MITALASTKKSVELVSQMIPLFSCDSRSCCEFVWEETQKRRSITFAISHMEPTEENGDFI
jgi:hypothetical protein